MSAWSDAALADEQIACERWQMVASVDGLWLSVAGIRVPDDEVDRVLDVLTAVEEERRR